MELLGLALIMLLGRLTVDVIHGIKGTTPPHLEKARLKATTRTGSEGRSRSPYADGKPRLGDVAAVFWGDAMTDAIDLHNRRRDKKRQKAAGTPTAAEPKRGLLRQILDLLVRPVGERPAPPAVPGTAGTPAGTPAGATVPTWECAGCGLDFTGDKPAGDRCVPCTKGAGTSGARRTPPNPTTADPVANPNTDEGAPMSQPNVDAYRQSDEHQNTKNIPSLAEAMGFNPSTGGPAMSQSSSAGTATGEAHDVETALNQCDLLSDDLTRIDTSLDVIDEAITSASAATEILEAFLRSKNVDDTAVGGMSVARDMLSPTHIKALIDAVAAAKAGVEATRVELVRLQDVEQQLNGADGSVLNGR